MARFDKGKEVSAISQIPEPPSKCGVRDCDNDVNILITSVNKNGYKRLGAFSEFGIVRRNNGEQILTMREGNVFIRWIARCDACYSRDLTAYKSHLPKITNTDNKSLSYSDN